MKAKKSAHIQTGAAGEELAAGYLQSEGFSIIERNWRFGRREVDIIAEKSGVLHFIEVKTRRSARFGQPEVKVDNRKIGLLIDAAEEYLHRYRQWQRIQFDILAISLSASGALYLLIEDVSR